MDLHLSTIDNEAPVLARTHGLGLEVTEYCTPSFLDEEYREADRLVREAVRGVRGRILHAPFCELCPAAVDPLVVDVTRRRFRQALGVARSYGMKRMVVHSGFLPMLYHEGWFAERTVRFWQDFLTGVEADECIVVENVFERTPDLLVGIAAAVADPRLRLCLDIGHANVSGKGVPMEAWIDAAAPFLAHVHVHNNYGDTDAHNAPQEGTVDMAAALGRIASACPEATFTLECRDDEKALAWLESRSLL